MIKSIQVHIQIQRHAHKRMWRPMNLSAERARVICRSPSGHCPPLVPFHKSTWERCSSWRCHSRKGADEHRTLPSCYQDEDVGLKSHMGSLGLSRPPLHCLVRVYYILDFFLGEFRVFISDPRVRSPSFSDKATWKYSLESRLLNEFRAIQAQIIILQQLLLHERI